MMTVSPASNPMKRYRAVYRESNQTEREFDLYARSLSNATLSADELIGPQSTLLRVYENPDW